ncbi:A/G-specific adenine glycosylase [Feifania hominis]|uniref:Adenine DNA glycosylase n=1 Tax=Feifania hominis TaxID=2763660 RepID=A0A926DFY5_9FIRM|nr:A/G-specific adenine glycosylase [Feifania hominis]MBC8536579.1 A/G-specific adenine glycosylase [Feifania hominis]
MDQKVGLGEIVRPLLDWYAVRSRTLPFRSDPTPYHVWLSEIMLQQTRVEAALPYYRRFLEVLPTIADLAAADEQTLFKLWEGLGYYSRARNLQKCAKIVVERFGGELPADYDELLKLPGIGPYTAGAIGSIAFSLPVAAVDGNVLRVLSRLRADPEDILLPATRRRVTAELCAVMPPDSGSFNQALMELGALVCLPNGAPKCGECPLSALCRAHALGREEDFPQKIKKAARRVEERTILVLFHRGRVAIRRRPDRGLLAGLWELPSLPGRLTPQQAAERLPLLAGAVLSSLPQAKHVFSHVEWHMAGIRAELAARPDDPTLVFVTPQELTDRYALPSAFRAYADPIREKPSD